MRVSPRLSRHSAAVALVGRNDKGVAINWLLLSPQLLDDFRQALADVDSKDLPTGNAKIAEVRDDPQFYRILKRGLLFNRQSPSGKRPFSGGKYAPIIEIFANGSIVSEGKFPGRSGPIVVEVEWSQLTELRAAHRRSGASGSGIVFLRARHDKPLIPPLKSRPQIGTASEL